LHHIVLIESAKPLANSIEFSVRAAKAVDLGNLGNAGAYAA
jgi:hypothetical protein